MKKTFLTFSILLCLQICFAQKSPLKNEELVFSFNTTNGKTLWVCLDKNKKYLVYRFGTDKKIELEFPVKKDETSFQKFEYSYWLRGGGTDNEGLDLNYLAFDNNGIKYVVYDNFYAIENERKVGIKVYQNSSSKTIEGIPTSKKGTLTNLRDIENLKKSDEIYEN